MGSGGEGDILDEVASHRGKNEKEDFISGLNGTTLWEVNIVIHYSIILIGVRASLAALLPSAILQGKWFRFLLEYFALVVPLIVITTVLADDSTLVFVTTLVVVVCSVGMSPGNMRNLDNERAAKTAVELRRCAAEEILNADYDISDEEEDILKQNADNKDSFLTAQILAPNRVPFGLVTMFRSLTAIISCLCILAVDFWAFPRRLAKTECFGTGLMDTGVGLFIVANGLVSPEARGKHQFHKSFLEKLAHIRNAVLSSWPLWSIGILRVLMVKMIGYQEHVSEYGVHWNFFFTLASVRIFSAMFLVFFSVPLAGVLSAICILSYQFLLLHPSIHLSSVILSENRTGFFMANKEGICSSVGYLSLFLASVNVGSFVFKGGALNVMSWVSDFFKAFIASACLWVLTTLADSFVQPISRRFANLAFVSWILALFFSNYVVAQLLNFFLVFCAYRKKIPAEAVPMQILLEETGTGNKSKLKYTPPPPPLCLLAAVNRNLFVYFILSNISTGVINLVFDTLSIPNAQALLILSIHMLGSLLFVWVLHIKQITLKFW